MITKEPNAVVIQKVEIAPGLIKLRVGGVGWEIPEFKPGQYSILGLPGTAPRCHDSGPEDYPPEKPDKLIIRAYSVASSSVAREYLEFYISLVRSGSLTPRLFNLEKGDKLWLSTHFSGMFTLHEVPIEYSVALIATGTGVAPYMSMIRTEVYEGLRYRFAVVHGARNSWDLGYNNELRTLNYMSDCFTYFPIISEPQEELTPWKGHVGFVQKVWEDGLIEKAWGFKPTRENTHIFLCGAPIMINSVMPILKEEGFEEHTKDSPGQIHMEKFDI